MHECRNWIAWYDLMPRAQPILHVTGECTFPTTGYSFELRRYKPPSLELAQPFVRGPASRERTATPPTFSINPQPNPFYAVEVTTRPDLFDRANHDKERAPNNFYATWQDSVPFFSSSTYTLPAVAWERLKHAERLYYRIWTNASITCWLNSATTTPDTQFQEAPFIQITQGQPPELSVEGSGTASRTESSPMFIINSHPNSFYAVEVTTRAELFDLVRQGSERNASNFYATWQEPVPFRSDPIHTLSSEAWERLKNAERLYYRIWASASNTAWINPVTTTPDAQFQTAPFIQLIDLPIQPSSNQVILVQVVNEPFRSIEKTSSAIPVHYREQMDNADYKTVLILPDQVTVSIDLAY